MRQQEVFNKIGNIIRELNEQYEYMQIAGNLFNELELELMAANAHFLSDHVAILRKLSQAAEKSQPITDQPAETSLKPLEPSVLEQTTGAFAPANAPVVFEFDTKKINPNEVNIIYEMEPDEIIRHELVIDDTGDDWDEDDNNGEFDLQPQQPEEMVDPASAALNPTPGLFTPAPDLFAPAPQPVMPEAKPVIPEPIIPEPDIVIPEPTPIPATKPAVHASIPVPEEQVLTLNDLMSARLASRKTDQLTAQPISDLKGAITLNDKLLFIKDLFHGYSLAYAEAIDILNRMHSFEEAEKFLNGSYAAKYNWTDKQATADKIYALLRRRYN